jgi:hypothetical protein
MIDDKNLLADASVERQFLFQAKRQLRLTANDAPLFEDK